MASRFMTLKLGRSLRATRTKFDPMKPRPPVTSQRMVRLFGGSRWTRLRGHGILCRLFTPTHMDEGRSWLDRWDRIARRHRGPEPAEKGAFFHVRRYDARTSGSRSPLRPPNPSLESEDETVHLPGAQRDLHHRSRAHRPKTARNVRRDPADVARGESHPLRRYQEAGSGSGSRRGRPRRNLFHQPALAGRNAHQLRHDSKTNRALARAGKHEGARRF